MHTGILLELATMRFSAANALRVHIAADCCHIVHGRQWRHAAVRNCAAGVTR